MSSRIRKILKHTVIAVLSLAVLFLVLNLFMADAKTCLGGISRCLEKRTGCGLESGRFLHEGKAIFRSR